MNVSKRLSVSTLPRPVFALHGHVEGHKGCMVFGFGEQMVNRNPRFVVVGQICQRSVQLFPVFVEEGKYFYVGQKMSYAP